MSGFWSIEKVENHGCLWVDAEQVSLTILSIKRERSDHKLETQNADTTALIWSLPFIEVEEITADNMAKTLVQVRMLELAPGAMLQKAPSASDEETFLTLDHVRRHIGLRVGAGMCVQPFEETVIKSLRSRAAEL
jgi:hypothetical protein